MKLGGHLTHKYTLSLSNGSILTVCIACMYRPWGSYYRQWITESSLPPCAFSSGIIWLKNPTQALTTTSTLAEVLHAKPPLLCSILFLGFDQTLECAYLHNSLQERFQYFWEKWVHISFDFIL